MNHYEPFNNFTTDELSATTRFMELLLQVRERVSSPKLTSTITQYSSGKGFLDKVECYHPTGLNLQTIKRKCEELGLSYHSKRLADKKLYLEISKNEKQIHFFLGHPHNQILRKIFFNPSGYKSVNEMMSFLEEIFDNEMLELVITRIDFTLDLCVSYQEILKGLDIKHKRSNSEYSRNSVRSGIVIGGMNDKIKIYDKAAQLRLKTPLTRIERQIRKPVLFVRSVKDLSNSLEKILNFKPFDVINLNHIDFEEGQCRTQEQLNKMSELKALIDHEGYFLAKKKLNQNDNFQRDFGKFFKLTEFSRSANDQFQEDIITYFGGLNL